MARRQLEGGLMRSLVCLSIWLKCLSLLAVVVAGASLTGSVTAMSLPPATVPSLPADASTVYLPLIVDHSPARIWGIVTDSGVPAAGIQLDLFLHTPQGSSLVAAVATDASGLYSFYAVPGVMFPSYYGVEYHNDVDPTRLRSWTIAFGPYAAGTNYHLRDFDIADIELVSPASGTTVFMPPAITFSWTPRAASPDDHYFWYLFAPGPDDPAYYDQDQFGSDYTSLSHLPAGFSYGTVYWWSVISYPEYPYNRIEAQSFENFRVTFMPASAAFGWPLKAGYGVEGLRLR
jgi:hypothetical protein